MTRSMKAARMALVVALVAVAPLAAQDANSALSTAEVRSLVENHAASADERRSALTTFLGRSEVRDVARDAGIDIQRVETAAASLSADDLATLAPHLRKADEALVGGDTLVISTTAIIIGLLVLIIILVA